MIRGQASNEQGEFWIARNVLARGASSKFYDKLNETLGEMDFSSKVHKLCAPLCSKAEKGRPPIDPVVYLKMLMVGFLENIESERGMHIERSFAHLLDSGGSRRTTLRGRENLRPLQRQLQRSTTGFCAKSKLQCD